MRFADASGLTKPSFAALQLFGLAEQVSFESGWEVLMAQREVKNWTLSTEQNTVRYAYPGEWSFAGEGPGGEAHEGESVDLAARRVLSGHLHVEVPASARLRLMSVWQTPPVRRVSYLLYNYVVVAEEPGNEWLLHFDTGAANAWISKLRDDLAKLLESKAFWALPSGEKEKVALEIRQVQWLGMREAAARLAGAEFAPPDRQEFVDDWQRAEFARYGVPSRTGKYLTLAMVLEVEAFPSSAALFRHCANLDPADAREKALWLNPTLSLDEAREICRKAGPALEGRISGVGTARVLAADGRPSWVALREARAEEDIHRGILDAEAEPCKRLVIQETC